MEKCCKSAIMAEYPAKGISDYSFLAVEMSDFF